MTYCYGHYTKNLQETAFQEEMFIYNNEMNPLTIDSFSELHAPGNADNFTQPMSLMAVTSYGEIFSYGLAQDSQPTLIRSSLDGGVLKNYFDTSESNSQDFQNLVCNQRGNLIALWSDKDVAFARTDKGVDEKLKPVLLLKNSTVPIVKVMFHPFFDYALVVLLQKGKLILYDIRREKCKEQSYELTDNMVFTSFCFGPEIEWLRFTVFVTTNCGKIFALSPILPNQCCLPKSVIQELLSWVKKQYYVLESACGGMSESKISFKSYLNQVHDFLLDFSNSSISHQNADSSNRKPIVNVECIGPLSIVSSDRVKYSHHEVSYCDISVLVLRERNHHKLPIFSVVDSSGHLCIMLLSAKINATNIFYPTWKNGSNFFPKPEFVVADLSRFELLDTHKTSQLKLYQDLVNTENVYCCNTSEGVIWLMVSRWLISTNDDSTTDNFEETELCEVYRTHSMLAGVALSHDPYSGSCMLLKSVQGDVTAINLGVNQRLNKLNWINEHSLTDKGALKSIYTVPIQQPTEFTRVAEGFTTLPKPISGSGNLYTDKKMLVDVCEALESKVVQPVIALSQQLRLQRTKLSAELVSQKRLIHGDRPESTIVKKIHELHERETNLNSRVKAIISNFETQRRSVHNSLMLVKKMRLQLSALENRQTENISKINDIARDLGKELLNLKISSHQHAIRPKLQFKLNGNTNFETEQVKVDVVEGNRNLENSSTGGSVGISGHTIIAQRYTGLFVNGPSKNFMPSCTIDNGIKSPIKSFRVAVSTSAGVAERPNPFPKAEFDMCLEAATCNEQQIEDAKIELVKLRNRVRNLQTLQLM